MVQLTRLWDRLTAPSPAIQDAVQQHAAQLLSSLLLALNLINITVQMFRALRYPATINILLPVILSLPLALYGLSRTRFHQLAACLVIAFFPIVSIIATIQGLSMPTGIFFAFFGVLLSNALLSKRITALVASLTVLALAIIPLVPAFNLSFEQLLIPLAFIILASGLLLIIQSQQEQIAKTRQRALQEEEARYRNLYQNTPVMMHSVNTEGQLISVNDFWLDSLGYKRDQVLGRRSIEFMTEASRRYAEEETLPKFWQEGIIDDIPYQMVKKNGEIIDVLLSAVLQRDEAGQPSHALSFILDITERKRVETERQQYIERLQILRDIDQAILSAQSPTAVAEAALVHIRKLIPCRRASLSGFNIIQNKNYILAALTDDQFGLLPGHRHRFAMDPFWQERLTKGKITILDDIQRQQFSSPQMIRLQTEGVRAMFCAPLMTAEGLLGALNLLSDEPGVFKQSHAEIVADITPPLTVALQQAQLLTRIEQHSNELEIRVAARSSELSERMAEVEQLNRGMVNLLQDMQSANRQLEVATTQLKATNAELESFAYAVSHDLRSPLRAVTGFSQALLEDYYDMLDTEGQGFLQRVDNAGQRMGHLIDDLLRLSRITRQEMQPVSINASVLVNRIMVQYCQDEPEREVTTTIAPEVMVKADERLLLIVLENLLGNAWKYTGTTAGAHIEFGTTSEDEVTIYFVRDNGAGFDMAYADKLFGPFQRLHRPDEFEGSGIGLATVQRIIHRHGGRVWAEAEVGQGATFYFTL